MARRWGTSAMFRLVMKPKMKNSAVTVINGTRYPGDVSADDCLVCVAISCLIPASSSWLARSRCKSTHRKHLRSQDSRPNLMPACFAPTRNPAQGCTQHYTENPVPGKWADRARVLKAGDEQRESY